MEQQTSRKFDRNSENYRPWSELPYLILISITNHLLSLTDLISFSHVCRHWRSCLYFISTPPLLLSPPFLYSVTLSLSGRKHYIPNSALEPTSFMGLSHGFLVYLKINKPILLNPLTKFYIELPCLTFEEDWSFAALTGPVTSSNRSTLLVFTSTDVFRYVCVGLKELAWCTGNLNRSICIASVVTLKNGRVFAVNDKANTVVEFVINEDHSVRAESFDVKGIDQNMVYDKSHFGPNLVECGVDMLLVLFVQNEENGNVVKINVFKLDFGRKVWVEVKRLVNYAIFIDCSRRCGYSCYRMDKWGEMNDCMYLTGPGTDSFVQLPTDGTSIPQWRGHDSIVSRKWMNAPRWPSPFWIRAFF